MPADHVALEAELRELTDAYCDGLAAAFARHGLALLEVGQSLRLDFEADAGVATGEEAA